MGKQSAGKERDSGKNTSIAVWQEPHRVPGPDNSRDSVKIDASARIRFRRDHIMDEILSCINVQYAYERGAFKHVSPEGGGLTDGDLQSLQEALERSFETFFYEKFEIDG